MRFNAFVMCIHMINMLSQPKMIAFKIEVVFLGPKTEIPGLLF